MDDGWTWRLTTLMVWAFVVAVALILAVAFGLALSRLPDAGVIAVGVIALATGVVGVGLQSMFVASQVDTRDMSVLDPDNLFGNDLGDPDRYSVRSYSLLANPEAMRSMGNAYTVEYLEKLGVRFKEPGFINCNGIITPGEVHYNSDPLIFLVINPGGKSNNFQGDVSRGRVTSILLGGVLYRILYLTTMDFATTDTTAISILSTNDVYALSQRGLQGATPVVPESGCNVVDLHVPWKVNPKEVSGVAELTVSSSTVPIQVWGVSGK